MLSPSRSTPVHILVGLVDIIPPVALFARIYSQFSSFENQSTFVLPFVSLLQFHLSKESLLPTYKSIKILMSISRIEGNGGYTLTWQH